MKLIVTPTNATQKMVRDIKVEWPKRLETARHLFLLDVANFMLKEVQDRRVEIDTDGKSMDYAQDLRIGILESGRTQDVIAIYLNSRTAKVSERYAPKTVLYFQPHEGSPPWMPLMVQYGPWPASMVPVKVGSMQAKVISRRARPDEIVVLAQRITAERDKIERDLRDAGANRPKVGMTEHGIGMTAHEDIGYNVLRREFGFDGYKGEPHWRPAIRETKSYAAASMAKVVKYIQTGNENVFDLPDKTGKIGMSDVKEGRGFAKEIAPFVN